MHFLIVFFNFDDHSHFFFNIEFIHLGYSLADKLELETLKMFVKNNIQLFLKVKVLAFDLDLFVGLWIEARGCSLVHPYYLEATIFSI